MRNSLKIWSIVFVSMLTLLAACGDASPTLSDDQAISPQACSRPTLSVRNPGPYRYSSHVRHAQNQLLDRGNATVKGHIIRNGGADGLFGQGTYAAVRAYQTQVNELLRRLGEPRIAVDGIIGPDTWKYLGC